MLQKQMWRSLLLISCRSSPALLWGQRGALQTQQGGDRPQGWRPGLIPMTLTLAFGGKSLWHPLPCCLPPSWSQDWGWPLPGRGAVRAAQHWGGQAGGCGKYLMEAMVSMACRHTTVPRWSVGSSCSSTCGAQQGGMDRDGAVSLAHQKPAGLAEPRCHHPSTPSPPSGPKPHGGKGCAHHRTTGWPRDLQTSLGPSPSSSQATQLAFEHLQGWRRRAVLTCTPLPG